MHIGNEALLITRLKTLDASIELIFVKYGIIIDIALIPVVLVTALL
jgi:hypothetical protein